MDTHDQHQEIDLLSPTPPITIVDAQRDSGFYTQVFLDKVLVDVTSLQEKVVSRIHRKMLQAMEQAPKKHYHQLFWTPETISSVNWVPSIDTTLRKTLF